MNRSTIAVAACVLVLVAANAAADINNYSYSANVVSFADTIEGVITASTSGASSPHSLDSLSNWMWIGTYPGSATVTTSADITVRGSMVPLVHVSTFSFSGLPAGSYNVWVGGRAWAYTTGGTWTLYSSWSYLWGVEDSTGEPALIPTVGHFGLLVLGLLLATTGVILLRRT